MNTNRTTPRHIIIKMAKGIDKERILNAAREKHGVKHKGIAIRLYPVSLQKLCRPKGVA